MIFLEAGINRTSISACSAVWLCTRHALFYLSLLVSILGQDLGLGSRRTPITRPSQILQLTSADRTQPYPLRVEATVLYFDPVWHLCWLASSEAGEYLHLSKAAPFLPAGQRILIEGTIIPDHGLEAERVKITVLDPNPVVPSIPGVGCFDDTERLDSRLVLIEAYVDSQQDIDAGHLRLNLVVEGRPVVCWVKPRHYPKLPDFEHKMVRLTALYARRFDPTKTRAHVELWVGDESQIEELCPLSSSPAFRIPQTPIDELFGLPSGTKVRVSGLVQFQDLGSSLTIRNKRGQVLVKTAQKQGMPIGSTVECVGEIIHQAGQCYLEKALVRYCDVLVVNEEGNGVPPQQITIEQLRNIHAGEAERGRPATITGMVTWAMPESDFFFLQDVTGGARIRYNPAFMSAPKLLKAISIEGVTRRGPNVTELELRSFSDFGSMSAPLPKAIGLDQALSGSEDGQWVVLRGFLRRVVSDKDWHWIHLTTPSGDFVAHLNSPVKFVATTGSLVRIQGVCETLLNDQGKISGVTLRVPFLHDITVEEPAPADLFDLTLRPLQSLDLLSLSSSMIRVRVAGVVTQCRDGEYIQIQEEGFGVLLRTSTAKGLTEGDMIEAVGILGREGRHAVIREAVYRQLGSANPPEPKDIHGLKAVSSELEGALVRVEGVLLDAVNRTALTRYTLQDGNNNFEAILERWPGAEPLEALTPGSKLSLTGICKLEYDDNWQINGYSLRLRSAGDIVVLEPANLWTKERALTVMTSLGVCVLLSFFWVYALRRRVSKQTMELKQQLEHQHRLEAGVQHASRLESLGLMAGGIAHDFNNLLTVIMGNLGLALVNPEGAKAVGEHLKDAMKGASRARDLTQQLLTFARGGSPVRQEVDFPALIQEIAKTSIHGTTVRSEFRFEPGLWAADIDRKQISVVLQNVIFNAIQAMPAGGLLRVDVGNVFLSENALHGVKAGRYLHVIITDSGEGIAPSVLPRIFDPYFSTKKGSAGLGLATSYSIIRRHEGHIEARSHFGQGTSLMIHLPAASNSASLAKAPLPAKKETPPASLKGFQVLLMDDEESIRRIASIVLHRMGLEVTLASEGAEALRLFKEARASGHPFDLVILDLTIPGGIGGRETMEAIRLLDPIVPSIVSSGYSSDPVMADFKRYGFTAMVPKPYEVEELNAAVSELLLHKPA